MNLPYAQKQGLYVASDDLFGGGYSSDMVVKAGVIDKQYATAYEKSLPFFNEGLAFGGGGGFTRYRKSINDMQLLAEYANNPIVYQCAEKNATQVASMDWGIYQLAKPNTQKSKRLPRKLAKRLLRRVKMLAPDDADVVEVTDSPLISLLARVNEDINGYQLFKITQLWLEIIGRAYWYIDEDEGGNPRVTPLMPWRVLPLRDASGYVVSYQYYNYTQGAMIGGNDPKGADLTKLAILDKANVIDFRFMSAADPFGGGQSPLSAAIRSVLMSSQYTDWLNATLGNRQRPDWVLVPKDANSSDEERKRIEEKLFNRVGGNNNGKPIVLDAAYSITNLAWSPTDLAPLEIAADVLKRVAGAFGIPSALMDSDAATYSNYETAMEDYARGAIAPRLSLIEQTINENLSKLGIDDEIFLCFDNPIPEDEEFKLKESAVNVTKVQWGGASLTVNEKRQLLGFEPTGNPDDDIVAPPIAAAPPTVAEPLPPDPTALDEGKAMDWLMAINRDVSAGTLPRATAINIAERLGFADVKSLVAYPPAPATPQTAPKCGCAAKGAKVVAALQPSEARVNRLKKAIAGWFLDLKAEADKHFKTFTKDTGNLPTSFVDIDHWINDLKGREDDLAYRCKPLIEIEAQNAADEKQQHLMRVGASPDAFDVAPHEITKAIDKRVYKFAQSTLDTTRKDLTAVVDGIKERVTDAVSEGQSNEELKQAISEHLENAADYQAERIARSESSWAVHAGQIISAKASGIVKGMMPLISDDACPICMEYADEALDIDDLSDSVNGGDITDDDMPPWHPNCACSLSEIIDTDALGGDTGA